MSPKSELAIAVKNQLESLFNDVAEVMNKEYKKLVNKAKGEISKASSKADELSFLLYLYEYTNYSFANVIDAIQEDGSINDWCIYIETVYLYRELLQRDLPVYTFLYELEKTHANFVDFNFTNYDDWKKRVHLYLEHVRSL